MRKTLTNLEFDTKCTSKGILYKRLDTYIGTKIAIKFQCNKCFNIWRARPDNILAGRGCPNCYQAKSKHTDNTLDILLLEKQIYYTRVDTYINNSTPINFKCNICSNLWKATPGSILSKISNCPYCPRYSLNGFKPNKEAYLYIIQIDNFLKVGITNRKPNIRYKEITNKKVIEIKVIEGKGSLIKELEQKIHNNFKHYYPEEKLKSGNTECFHIELKENILGMLV